MPRATLCLVAVVDPRDGDSIVRMVASARPHISSWVIASVTGDDHAVRHDDTVVRHDDSVVRHDDTVVDGDPVRHRVEASLGDVPGEWLTLTRADDVFSHVSPHASHVLLLDADMTLSVEGDLRDMLAAAPGDALLVRVDDNGYQHRLPLVVRNRPGWTFDDAHHTVRCDASVTTVAFDPARVTRHADGTRIIDTLLRDRELLYARIEADPADSSVMFRLAKTLADLGETDPSLFWFTRCARANSRGEETYCSWYFIGEHHLLRGDLDAASSAFMWAVQVRPARVEAYYQLAHIHNLSRDYPKARMWAEAGMLQRASLDAMFVQPWMRRWGLPYQWALAAWWTGDARAARTMLQSLNDARLLVEPYASQAVQLAARRLPGEEPLRYG